MKRPSMFAWLSLPLAIIPEVAYAMLSPSKEPLFTICYVSAGLFALLWVLRHATFNRTGKRSISIGLSFKARGTAAKILAASLLFTEIFLMLSFSDVKSPIIYSKFDLIPCGITAVIVWAFLMGVDKLWNKSAVVS